MLLQSVQHLIISNLEINSIKFNFLNTMNKQNKNKMFDRQVKPTEKVTLLSRFSCHMCKQLKDYYWIHILALMIVLSKGP